MCDFMLPFFEFVLLLGIDGNRTYYFGAYSSSEST